MQLITGMKKLLAKIEHLRAAEHLSFEEALERIKEIEEKKAAKRGKRKAAEERADARF